MLGPEASLYVKLLIEDCLPELELVLVEEIATELAIPPTDSEAEAAAVSSADLRALQWTKLDCADTTRMNTPKTNQRLLNDVVAFISFLIAISFFSGWKTMRACAIAFTNIYRGA